MCTATGAATATIPTHHASAVTRSDAVAAPDVSPRIAVTTAETGWCSAHPWSQPGMVVTGTNAADANTRGIRTGNDAAWAPSGLPAARPTVAKIHDIAYPNSRINVMAPSRSRALPSGRQPTAYPTAPISAT